MSLKQTLLGIGKHFVYQNFANKKKRFINRLMWEKTADKLKSIGENCRMGLNFSVKGPEHISMGDNFCAGDFVKLETWENYCDQKTGYIPELVIGSNVTMAERSYVSCMHRIVIEDGVLFGEGAFVCDNSHGQNSLAEIDVPPAQRKLYSKGPVHIGKNVWLGRNVCVMPGVTIGENSVIGANAVVTHDIPPNSIAAGIPARVIKSIQ